MIKYPLSDSNPTITCTMPFHDWWTNILINTCTQFCNWREIYLGQVVWRNKKCTLKFDGLLISSVKPCYNAVTSNPHSISYIYLRRHSMTSSTVLLVFCQSLHKNSHLSTLPIIINSIPHCNQNAKKLFTWFTYSVNS